MTKFLRIENLPSDQPEHTVRRALVQAIRPFGYISKMSFSLDPATNLRTANLELYAAEVANKVVTGLNGTRLLDQELKITPIDPAEARSSAVPSKGKVIFYSILDQFGFVSREGNGGDEEGLYFPSEALPQGQFVVKGDLVEYSDTEIPGRPGKRSAKITQILKPVARGTATVISVPSRDKSQGSMYELRGPDGVVAAFGPSDVRRGTSLYVDDEIEFSSDSGRASDVSNARNYWPTSWAYFSDLSRSLGDLERLALKGERWRFCNDQRGFPKILWSYLYYTFFKVRLERKLIERDEWATFNTGLVDDKYKDIFALFRRRGSEGPRELQWEFNGFGCQGERGVGQQLTRTFGRDLPPPAKYFGKVTEVVLDVDQPVDLSGEHIVVERIDRFPHDFLRKHLHEVPRTRYELQAIHYWLDSDLRGREFLQNCESRLPRGVHERVSRCLIGAREGAPEFAALRQCLDTDLTATDVSASMYADVGRAVEQAIKRVRWNFKTAVPMWYPMTRTLQLLLPLSLGRDPRTVDVALVVERTQSGAYIGHTILPLEWAYKNSRLVCRPDSDWLDPGRINDTQAEEA